MKRLFRNAIAAAAITLTAPLALAQTPPNVLIVGQIAEPQSLVATATNDFRILVNIYDGLVRFKSGTLQVEPALAESWTISEDGKTYTFKLRQGVKFHDGSAFDAEAVKFNFDRMLDENHPFYNTGPFPLSFNFAAVDTVNAIDPQTVEFKLKEAFAPFLSNLAYPTGLSSQRVWQGLRPPSFRHGPVQVRGMAVKPAGRGGAQWRLLERIPRS